MPVIARFNGIVIKELLYIICGKHKNFQHCLQLNWKSVRPYVTTSGRGYGYDVGNHP